MTKNLTIATLASLLLVLAACDKQNVSPATNAPTSETPTPYEAPTFRGVDSSGGADGVSSGYIVLSTLENSGFTLNPGNGYFVSFEVNDLECVKSSNVDHYEDCKARDSFTGKTRKVEHPHSLAYTLMEDFPVTPKVITIDNLDYLRVARLACQGDRSKFDDVGDDSIRCWMDLRHELYSK